MAPGRKAMYWVELLPDSVSWNHNSQSQNACMHAGGADLIIFQ